MTYKIIRFYEPQLKINGLKMYEPNQKRFEVICRGLSLKEARQHCNNDYNRKRGVYFDAYVREGKKNDLFEVSGIIK